MGSEHTINRSSLIAGVPSAAGEGRFRAVNPRTGEPGPEFAEATAGEIADAAGAAAQAFGELREWSPARLASLLETVADFLQDAGAELVSTADEETALGRAPRLEGELARTTGQWRAFARMVRAGWHLEVIIDHATESHPDIRRMLQPLGPVAVFGASNFPLAFSVPGGDTASALAAGCPVVAKGHPSHPATSELSARAISAAVDSEGGPPGAFSMVQGSGTEVGKSLVVADDIRAVGFTGSFAAGRSIHDLASTRSTPIPVFAEMGSLNPVFITRAAMDERGEEIARGLAASMTLGVGQFCTKPGLAFLPTDGEEEFAKNLAAELTNVEASPMLNPDIAGSFKDQMDRTSALPEIDVLMQPSSTESGALACTPGLLRTTIDGYLNNQELSEEHFGPVIILVITPAERMIEAARHIHGSLTATIHASDSEAESLSELHRELRQRVGRLIWNGFPTGVAVVPSMHHGGPYPATTNSLHTSVGMTAVRRFLRPVAFQNAPREALPPALQEENPLGIRRLVDWNWE